MVGNNIGTGILSIFITSVPLVGIFYRISCIWMFKTLDQDYFSGNGPAGLILRRLMVRNIGGVVLATKLMDGAEPYAKEPSGSLESVQRQMNQMEQLVQVVDAESSIKQFILGAYDCALKRDL